MGLTAATATHTSIFSVNTVSSVCVMSAVGQSLFCANTGKIVQVDGASSRPKEGITQSSVVCSEKYRIKYSRDHEYKRH